MPIEPEPTTRGTTGWTVEAVKELLETVVERNDRRYQERFDATEAAIRKAEAATEKRFEGVNEFRNTLADQQRTFIPRQEFEAVVASMNDKILTLQQANVASVSGSSGSKVGMANVLAILGGLGILVLLLERFIPR